MLLARCNRFEENKNLKYAIGVHKRYVAGRHGMVWYDMVWKVQPSKASSCRYRVLIDEVIRESRSPQHVTHLPHVWDLLLAQHRH